MNVSSPEKKKFRFGWKRLIFWFCFVLVLAALYWLSRPCVTCMQKGAFQAASLENMKLITSAVELYRSEHGGKLPERFAQLVPGYMSIDYAYLFYTPANSKYGASFPPPSGMPERNKKEDLALADVFSPYGLLQFADGRVMVYERFPIWPDSVGYCIAPANGKSADLSDHLKTGRISRKNFVKFCLLHLKP